MKPRVFFTTFAVANLGLVLYGAQALAFPTALVESFTRHVYQFPPGAASAIEYLAALYRLMGFFNLLLGVVGALLLLALRDTPLPRLARLLTLSTCLAYLGPIVFDNTVGQIGVFEIVEHILFAAALVVGLVAWKSSFPRLSIRDAIGQ